MSPDRPAAPVTLADVAAHASVSLATASRALNGSARTVNAEMKERVLASSRELGYSANAQAQAVARGSTRTVAVVLGDIADPYFSAIAAGVIDEAEKNDLVVTMWATGSQPDRLLSTLAVMRSQRPQALIVAQSGQLTPEHGDPIAQELLALERAGTTICTIGVGSGPLLHVLVDNFGASSALAQALVNRGYSRFLVLSGDPNLRTPAERADGFVAGLRALGIEPIGVRTGGFSRAGGFATMTAAIAEGQTPDCVFAVTDVMALGVAAAVRNAGLEPGLDVGIAGFDDIQAMEDASPAMTTVAIPLAGLGAEALRATLGNRTEGDDARIPGTVVLRASTPVRL
ncbi:MAG: LacI family DNA-binding transcriptional regulator [Pseudolysinimonas sp.]